MTEQLHIVWQIGAWISLGFGFTYISEFNKKDNTATECFSFLLALYFVYIISWAGVIWYFLMKNQEQNNGNR